MLFRSLRCLEQDLDGIAAELARWGRFSQPVRLRVAHDQPSLRQWAPCSTQLQLAGVASATDLCLLAPSCWPQPPHSRALRQTLLHELAHVLLYQRCSPTAAQRLAVLPTWFREGMACVAAEGPPLPNRRRELAAHPLLGELPNADDALMGREGEASYLLAGLLFQAWLDRFGRTGLHAVCRAMRAGHGFASAHRSACGCDPEGFVQPWLASVRAEAATG